MSDSNITDLNLIDISTTSQSLVIIQVAFYIVITIIGTIANLVLCCALLRKKQPRKASEYFILNLALTDLVTCSIGIPLDIAVILVKHWPFGAFMCKVVYPFQTLLTAVSVGTLACMAMERYRAIVTPFKTMFSVKFVRIAIFAVWCFSVILVSPYVAVLKHRDRGCYESWQGDKHSMIFTLCVFLIFYAVPLCVIAPTYVRIGFRLHSNDRTMLKFSKKQGQGNKQFRALVRQRTKSNIVIARTFLFGAIAFAICLLPYHVMWLWYDMGEGKRWTHFNDALVFANALVYFNSLVDPFIFGRTEALEWRKSCSVTLVKCLNLLGWRTSSGQRFVTPKVDSGDHVMWMHQVSIANSPKQQCAVHDVTSL
ncbi:galanin receptor type 1-like [Montipora capricornis]|uniref:galanin receptor type 1-like n=1 Tax=Montipora capricornis TaxID=246305 RepID=UPI0035F10443